jgi:hypothetical protein
MRARYYAPELCRFINADIVRGEISEAVTLNRYAYANGNPVSFVDPFGLSVSAQYSLLLPPIINPNDWIQNLDSLIRNATDDLMQDINDLINNLNKNANVRSLFKALENMALALDAKIPYGSLPDNYEHNKEYDITNRTIDDQPETIKLLYGEHSMKDVGCVAIAVYNAKILLGYDNVSLAEIIRTFSEYGVMTAQPILKGGFGTNPYKLGQVLEAENIKYTQINSYDEMLESPGIYIITVWNTSDLNSALHGITVHVKEDGTITPYNAGSSGLNMNSLDEDIFVTGYRVSRK